MRAPAAGTGGAADALSPGPGFATRPCVVNLPAVAAMQVFRQAFLQKGRRPAPQRPYMPRRAPPLPNPSLAPQRARRRNGRGGGRAVPWARICNPPVRGESPRRSGYAGFSPGLCAKRPPACAAAPVHLPSRPPLTESLLRAAARPPFPLRISPQDLCSRRTGIATQRPLSREDGYASPKQRKRADTARFFSFFSFSRQSRRRNQFSQL